MTALRHWIESRTPVAPAALALRMRPATEAAAASGSGRLEDQSLDAGMMLVDSILGDAAESRSGAITLLAADALITYAFEAAAEHPDGIDDLASKAMMRIAAAAEQAR